MRFFKSLGTIYNYKVLDCDNVAERNYICNSKATNECLCNCKVSKNIIDINPSNCLVTVQRAGRVIEPSRSL